jgi:D-3-phosphoglycerate dehydrogenase
MGSGVKVLLLTPGVLAGLNQCLLDAGVNVVGQALSTQGERGYVVTDTDDAIPEGTLADLRRQPHTSWLRTWTP